jgi:hypothetical protein
LAAQPRSTGEIFDRRVAREGRRLRKRTFRPLKIQQNRHPPAPVPFKIPQSAAVALLICPWLLFGRLLRIAISVAPIRPSRCQSLAAARSLAYSIQFFEWPPNINNRYVRIDYIRQTCFSVFEKEKKNQKKNFLRLFGPGRCATVHQPVCSPRTKRIGAGSYSKSARLKTVNSVFFTTYIYIITSRARSKINSATIFLVTFLFLKGRTCN